MRQFSIFSTVLALVFCSLGVNANSRKVAPSVPTSRVPVEMQTMPVPEIISFQEFQALDGNQKTKYIIQLQNLVTLASVSGGWELAGLGETNKWNLFLEQLVEPANAKGAVALAEKSKTCPPGQVLVSGWFSWQCVKDPRSCPKGQIAVHVSDGGLSCQLAATPTGGCPASYAMQKDSDSKNAQYCLPTKISGELAEISKDFQSKIAPIEPGKGTAVSDSVEAAPPKPTQCWWDELQKCETSSKKRKEIAKNWYGKAKDGELSCIYAGNVSGYKNPKAPKAGECKPINKASIGGKEFTCPVGQSICSPLIFGVQDFDTGVAHCVKGKNATDACVKKGSAANVVGLIMKAGPSANAEWDKLKEGLKNLVASCIVEDKEKNQVSISPESFQCQECQLVANRVVEMRKSLNSKLSDLSCELAATGSVGGGAASKGDKEVPVKSVR